MVLHGRVHDDGPPRARVQRFTSEFAAALRRDGPARRLAVRNP
ncbi:MAG: hypothetical protein QOI10_2195 [Solirubrobacterales bacterium]|nr:hypothetical protein [Solirubrobacterales bacterium]